MCSIHHAAQPQNQLSGSVQLMLTSQSKQHPFIVLFCLSCCTQTQNQLSGSVPPSAATARVLQELYINANRL